MRSGRFLVAVMARIELIMLSCLSQVLQQQTEAISRLATVLKKDMRDIDIILTEDTEMVDRHVDNGNGRYYTSQALVGFNRKYF